MMESMEKKKEEIKVEDCWMGWCSDPLMELGEEYDYGKSTSLGFMELLGLEDYLITSTTTSGQPTTPNSCSNISSQSQSQSSAATNTPPNEHHTLLIQPAQTLHQHGHGDEQQPPPPPGPQQHQNTNKLLKAKKTKEMKRQKEKEERHAFMTRSEVDHLEDGYKWRKYGQKAVKDTSYPRSYYRCTHAACNVKKRVERCSQDPTVLVTTYIGKHTHPPPAGEALAFNPCALLGDHPPSLNHILPFPHRYC